MTGASPARTAAVTPRQRHNTAEWRSVFTESLYRANYTTPPDASQCQLPPQSASERRYNSCSGLEQSTAPLPTAYTARLSVYWKRAQALASSATPASLDVLLHARLLPACPRRIPL